MECAKKLNLPIEFIELSADSKIFYWKEIVEKFIKLNL
jgi:hypothetical protein